MKVYFCFLKNKKQKTYYRISLEYLCEILGIEHMRSKDVEETEEYKNIFIFDSRYIDFVSKFSVKTERSAQPDYNILKYT